MDKSGARNLDFGPFGAGPSEALRGPRNKGEGHGEPQIIIFIFKARNKQIGGAKFGFWPFWGRAVWGKTLWGETLWGERLWAETL